MRVTVDHLPLFLLLALPVCATWHGWGTLPVLVALAALAALRQFLVLRPVFAQRDCTFDRMVLETQPLSPFVEKVRWCMDYAGINYEEEMDVASLGILITGRRVPTLRIPGKKISMQNSSDILRYLYGTHKGRDAGVSRFLEPTEESLRLEAMFDRMGEDIKAIFYPFLFKHTDILDLLPTVLGMSQKQIPAWQKLLFRCLLPVIQGSILKRNNITPSATAAAKTSTDKILEEVCHLLSDGREYLLGGDTPTFVDFHFAVMASAYLGSNDLYGGNVITANLSVDAYFPPEKAAEWRSTFQGRGAALSFADRIYKRHRLDKI